MTSHLAADPTLDADLADWLNPAISRPKLRVLGPVELLAVGEKTKEVESRPAYFAELAAYLAGHPQGGHRTRSRPTSGSRTTPCTPVWVSCGSGSASSQTRTSGTCPPHCGFAASRSTGSKASSWTLTSSGDFELAVRPSARRGSRTSAGRWS